MKTVILVRHAKTEHGISCNNDSERQLTDRGKKDALSVSEEFLKTGIKPDSIYSSHAARALATAHIFGRTFNWDVKNINIDSSIYNDGFASVLEIIAFLDENIDSVIFFGHNPDFTMLSNKLSGNKIESVPTCGLLCIDFGIKKWKDISGKVGQARFYLYPKLFK